jgi:hypothetical protein
LQPAGRPNSALRLSQRRKAATQRFKDPGSHWHPKFALLVSSVLSCILACNVRWLSQHGIDSDIDWKQSTLSLFCVLRAGNFPTLRCNCQPLRGAAVTSQAAQHDSALLFKHLVTHEAAQQLSANTATHAVAALCSRAAIQSESRTSIALALNLNCLALVVSLTLARNVGCDREAACKSLTLVDGQQSTCSQPVADAVARSAVNVQLATAPRASNSALASVLLPPIYS